MLDRAVVKEFLTDRGGCANILTRDVVSPGGALCSNTALVQVERFEGGS